MKPYLNSFIYDPTGIIIYTSAHSDMIHKSISIHDYPIIFSVSLLLWFNLVKVEIRELRPEVVAKSDEVLVHYRSRTNVRRGLSTKTLA